MDAWIWFCVGSAIVGPCIEFHRIGGNTRNVQLCLEYLRRSGQLVRSGGSDLANGYAQEKFSFCCSRHLFDKLKMEMNSVDDELDFSVLTLAHCA